MKIQASCKLIIARYVLCLVMLYLTQFFFYLFNIELFSIGSVREFATIMQGITKYGLAAMSVYLAPYLLFSLFPIPGKQNKYYQKTLNFLYKLGTILIILLNCIDMGYYRFTFKRLYADVFNFVQVGGDFGKLIPQFIRDFWYIIVLFIVIVAIFEIIDRKLVKKYKPEKMRFTKRWMATQTLIFCLGTSLLVLLLRGGFLLKPLDLMHVSLYASTQNAALVLNTPFTLYRTIGKEAIEQKEFFTKEEVAEIYNPIQEGRAETWADSLFIKPIKLGETNLVMIVLEGFSAEYFSTYNHTGDTYTPFLDSLAKKSIVFNGYANCKTSIDGIPSLLSSTPILMNESFITSVYQNNKLYSITSPFQNYNYRTLFFHGGNNGTMNFDIYAEHVGFESYFGLNEYNNEDDFDGTWGIYDVPFLQYAANIMDTVNEPFVSCIYTLSSHHPYKIHDKYVGKFPKGTLAPHETVGYTDFALKQFFEKVSKSKWFNNTVFLITADHSSIISQKEFKSQMGKYQIPMIIYAPNLKQGYQYERYLQQIDVLPTIIDLFHCDTEYFSFGKSVFSISPPFYICYSNGAYFLREGKYMSKYSEGTMKLYDVENDPYLIIDISDKEQYLTQKLRLKTEAIIQQYNNRMIRNELLP